MGSNIEPESHLVAAAAALRRKFDMVCFSLVYRSAAVGMDGEDFLNACCKFESGLSADQIRVCLKALEDAHGRDRSRGSWRPRTIDLDLLMFAGEVVDEELYRYAHAYVPASELVEIKLPEDLSETVTLVELRL